MCIYIYGRKGVTYLTVMYCVACRFYPKTGRAQQSKLMLEFFFLASWSAHIVYFLLLWTILVYYLNSVSPKSKLVEKSQIKSHLRPTNDKSFR